MSNPALAVPRTEAGRRLLAAFENEETGPSLEEVLAIEQEAALAAHPEPAREAALDVERLAGSRTWHRNLGHSNVWERCIHTTCRTFVAAEHLASTVPSADR